MADVLTYSDFWLLSLIPIIQQSAAIGYLWKIKVFIGCKISLILAAKNLILLAFYIIITIILATASEMEAEQPIEVWGVFVGFIMPIAISTLFVIYLRALKKALFPNPVAVNAANEIKRDAERDVKRDAGRDVERDINRDRERDYRRDLYKDRRDSSGNNSSSNSHPSG